MMVKETQALCSWGTISHYSEMGSLLFKQMIIIGQYKYLEQVFNICVWEKYIEKNVFIVFTFWSIMVCRAQGGAVLTCVHIYGGKEIIKSSRSNCETGSVNRDDSVKTGSAVIAVDVEMYIM